MTAREDDLTNGQDETNTDISDDEDDVNSSGGSNKRDDLNNDDCDDSDDGFNSCVSCDSENVFEDETNICYKPVEVVDSFGDCYCKIGFNE